MFEPETLTNVAKRTDELGQLARVFQGMAREVYAREERLRTEVAVLSEETGDRYRLILGKSASMNQAVDLAKRSRRAKRPFCSWAKVEPAKNSLPVPFTAGAIEAQTPLSPLTAWAL